MLLDYMHTFTRDSGVPGGHAGIELPDRASELQGRLARARRAFTTRNVDFGCAARLDRKAVHAGRP